MKQPPTTYRLDTYRPIRIEHDAWTAMEGAAASTEIGADYEDFRNVRTYYFFVGWWAGAISIAFVLWVI